MLDQKGLGPSESSHAANGQPQHGGYYQLMQPQVPRPRRKSLGFIKMGLRSLVAHVGAMFCGSAISDEAGFDDVDCF